jgi:DnaK suppressor protein
MMTPNQKMEIMRKFKTLFESQRKELLASPAALQRELSADPAEMSDEMDQIAANFEQSLRLRLKSREGLYLRKIESALSRIQNGSFGQCDDCGEEIEIKRLEARPTTTSCIACKEQEEKRERLFA